MLRRTLTAASLLIQRRSFALSTTRQNCKYTYRLGNYIYVPFTSQCNSVSLPASRGPGFSLPRSVIVSLLQVRDVERGTQFCQEYLSASNPSDSQERLVLPPLPSDAPVLELGVPTVKELLAEVQSYKQTDSDENLSVVIAGEGDAISFRSTDVVKFLGRLYTFRLHSHTFESTIRVQTNGLAEHYDELFAGIQHFLPKTIAFTVPLMTHDAAQYEIIMQPTGVDRPYERVLDFCKRVRDDPKYGLELTAVERPDVDVGKTNEVAGSLGVPIRWRSYHPV